jgi:MSHA biogenesis protein MshJ
VSPWLRQLELQVDQLSLRERMLTYLSGVAVLFIVWDFALLYPQMDKTEKLNGQLQQLEQKLAARAQEATVLAQGVGVNIDQGKLQQLEDLNQQIAAHNSRMSEMSFGLVPPDELLSVVREVLERSNELTISRIEYLPPEEVQINQTSQPSSQPSSQQESRGAAGVYKHTVELSLEGTYFDLLEYLQGLEELPWRLYWEGLTYEVSSPPLGDIDLRISTLSESGVRFENQ